MICPDQSCGAAAQMEVVSSSLCDVYEAYSEEEGIEFREVIDIVEVRCTEGHMFRGPVEFFRKGEQEWPMAA